MQRRDKEGTGGGTYHGWGKGGIGGKKTTLARRGGLGSWRSVIRRVRGRRGGKEGRKTSRGGKQRSCHGRQFLPERRFYNKYISSLSFVLVFDERKIKIEFGI